MKFRKVKAVFMKQFADVTHNRGVLLQFFLYPVILAILLFTFSSFEDADITRRMLVSMISVMFTGMIPMMNVFNMINQDKTQNTLRVLSMSTVKASEYLLGITSYILLLSLVVTFALGLIGGLRGYNLFTYVGVMLLGTATTLAFGSAMAMGTVRKGGTGTLIYMVSMLNGMIPMLSMFNASIQKISGYIYTTQISMMVDDIYNDCFRWEGIAIVAANFVIFLFVFCISYKKSRFYE